MNPAADDAEAPERPSKSQRKRDMAALQERLCEAIADAQRISDFEGRRRQMQFIGKLMREIDPAPIRAKLDVWSGAARAGTAQQRLVERWRERLLAEEAALTLFAAEYPRCDLQHLRSLIASVKRDRAANRAPKNFRELFRTIREVVAGKE